MKTLLRGSELNHEIRNIIILMDPEFKSRLIDRLYSLIYCVISLSLWKPGQLVQSSHCATRWTVRR
jgi:hypothetical protein